MNPSGQESGPKFPDNPLPGIITEAQQQMECYTRKLARRAKSSVSYVKYSIFHPFWFLTYDLHRIIIVGPKKPDSSLVKHAVRLFSATHLRVRSTSTLFPVLYAISIDYIFMKSIASPQELFQARYIYSFQGPKMPNTLGPKFPDNGS